MARLGRGQPFWPLVRPAINEAADSVVFTGPAPANVSVTAYFGAVSVSVAGVTPPNVSVAAFEGTPSVTTAGSTPPNVAVAAYYGSAFAGIDVIGQVANVSVQAWFGAVNVSTPGPTAPNVAAAAPTGHANTNVNGVTPPNVSLAAPGPNLTAANPFGAGGLSTGWSGFNGAMSATTSPPSGCPFGSALKYVNNGTTAGAMEGPGSWAALPSTQYTVSAWVYSSAATVQIGFDWLSNTRAYLSTSVTNFTVPVNTWTFVTTTVTSNASAGFSYARVGSGLLGETVYATEFYAYQPGLPGVASVTTPGPTVNVAVAAQYGAANVSTTVGVAPEAAQAYFGAVSVSLPGPTANVAVEAFYGLAEYIPNTYFAGPVASVSVAAPFGRPSGSFPGPVPAGVTVAAHFGAVLVSTSVAPASVMAQAPLGGPGASVVGQTARATVAAPMGAANTSATAPSVNVSVAASIGTVRITVAGPVAGVNVKAPAGGAGGGASVSPAQVAVTAPAGTASVSTTLGPASCGAASHLGHPGTSVTGRTAGIIVMAPVSPLVAGLYVVSAQATMGFKAWGTQQRRVWFGYGVVNTMNVQVPPGD